MPPRASLLTSGLDGLAATSPTVARLLDELYKLDDALQAAHKAATQDDENGERVVAAYEAFLRHRAALVAQLQTEGVAVPWQLHMRIDDIELTLRQRKETKTRVAEPPAHKPPTEAPKDESDEKDPLLPLKALILPSVLVAVVASVIYGVTSFAGL